MAQFTILDGGMGRELKRIGAPFRQPEWSALALMEAPEAVLAVHQSYVAAGADVLTSNSYSLVPFHIGEDRFRTDASRLADLAGQLARRAADGCTDRRVRVASSLPPLFGSYRPDLFDAGSAPDVLAPLIAGLAPHIDIWLAETLSATAEAEIVGKALTRRDKPLWLSFTLEDEDEDAARKPCLRSREPVEAAVRVARSLGAEALLFNCSQPEVMEAAILAAIAEARASDDSLTVGVYANAFPPQPKDTQANESLQPLREDLDPDGYLEWIGKWLQAGAGIVGGCCGIGPEHIDAIARSRTA